MTPETIIYFLTAFVILYMYMVRKKGLDRLSPDTFPEFEKAIFFQFKRLLDTAYERMLYLSGVFFLLGIITLFQLPPNTKLITYIALVGLFIYNIPPRNRIFQFLDAFDLDIKTLKKRGVKL